MKNQLEKSKIEDLTFIFEPIFAFSFAKNDKTYKIKLQKHAQILGQIEDQISFNKTTKKYKFKKQSSCIKFKVGCLPTAGHKLILYEMNNDIEIFIDAQQLKFSAYAQKYLQSLNKFEQELITLSKDTKKFTGVPQTWRALRNNIDPSNLTETASFKQDFIKVDFVITADTPYCDVVRQYDLQQQRKNIKRKTISDMIKAKTMLTQLRRNESSFTQKENKQERSQLKINIVGDDSISNFQSVSRQQVYRRFHTLAQIKQSKDHSQQNDPGQAFKKQFAKKHQEVEAQTQGIVESTIQKKRDILVQEIEEPVSKPQESNKASNSLRRKASRQILPLYTKQARRVETPQENKAASSSNPVLNYSISFVGLVSVFFIMNILMHPLSKV